MPALPNVGNTLSQPVYDSIIVPALGVGGIFFQVPIGGLIAAGIPKTPRHTNLIQAGRLEAANSLRIEAVSMHFPTTAEAGALPTVADKRAIRSGSIRLIMRSDTEYLRIPAVLIPSAGAGEVVVDATVALNDVQSGVQVVQNKFYLPQVIDLNPQESISVALENCDALVAATEVAFVLWGTYLRPVG